MGILHELEKEMIPADIPQFAPGDTLRVHLKIREGGKERVQVFQGNVIAMKKAMNRTTFTIRKVASGGYGVERILPLFSPAIDKIEVIRKGDVRRAKLYYLRDRIGKSARIKEKRQV